MQTVKVTERTMQQAGFQSWLKLFNTVTENMPDANFDTVIKLPVPFAGHKSQRELYGPQTAEITFGEIAFNAMRELKERLPDQQDFETLQYMNRLTFSMSAETMDKINKLERKIGWFALGY